MLDQLFIRRANNPEIQGMWVPKIGDLTNAGIIIKINGGMIFTENGVHWRHKDHLVWLPSQEQFQKMINHFGYVIRINKIPDGRFMLTSHPNDFINQWADSLEILWLALVMCLLFKKKWTGVTWDEK